MLSLIWLSVMTGASAAEPAVDKGTMGLSFDLGGLSLSSSDILMGGHYFLSKRKALNVYVGLDTELDALGTYASLRQYMNGGEARAFWEAGGGVFLDNSDLLILGGGSIGGEYWIKEHLSVWGRTGASLSIDNDVAITTRTSSLNLALYF
jgi:hypothetical protein